MLRYFFLHEKLFRLFFLRLNSHFRLVKMTLKAITLVQNIMLFSIFTIIKHLNDIFYFVSVQILSLRKYVSQLAA